MILQLLVPSGLVNALFEVAILILWAPLWHTAITYSQDLLIKRALKRGARITVDRSSEGLLAWRKVIVAHHAPFNLLVCIFAIFTAALPIFTIFFAELAINGSTRPIFQDQNVYLVNGNRLRDPDQLFAQLSKINEQAAAELTEITTVGTVLRRCVRPRSKTNGTVYLAAFPDRERIFEYDKFTGDEISGNLCVDGSEVTARMGYSVNSTNFDTRTSEITKGNSGATASNTELQISARNYTGEWPRDGVCEISRVGRSDVSIITAPRALGSRRAFSAFDYRNKPISIQNDTCLESITLMIGHLSYYTEREQSVYNWMLDDADFEDDNCAQLNATSWDADLLVMNFEAFGGYCLTAKSLLLNALGRLDNMWGAYGREDFLDTMLSFPHLGIKEVDEFADQTLVSWNSLSTQKEVDSESVTEVEFLTIVWTVVLPFILGIAYIGVLRLTNRDPLVKFSNPAFLLHCLTCYYSNQGYCWPKGKEKIQNVTFSLSDEGDHYYIGPVSFEATGGQDERPTRYCQNDLV